LTLLFSGNHDIFGVAGSGKSLDSAAEREEYENETKSIAKKAKRDGREENRLRCVIISKGLHAFYQNVSSLRCSARY
jgi:hypothetical protein